MFRSIIALLNFFPHFNLRKGESEAEKEPKKEGEKERGGEMKVPGKTLVLWGLQFSSELRSQGGIPSSLF